MFFLLKSDREIFNVEFKFCIFDIISIKKP